jgi:hypothetical protein
MSLSAIQVTTLRHNPVKNIFIMNEVSTALEGKERPFPNITNRLITLNLNANRRFLIARWDDGSQEYLNPWQRSNIKKVEVIHRMFAIQFFTGIKNRKLIYLEFKVEHVA